MLTRVSNERYDYSLAQYSLVLSLMFDWILNERYLSFNPRVNIINYRVAKTHRIP